MQYPVQYVNQPVQAPVSAQPQTVIVQVPRQPTRIYERYHSKQSVGLGITHICAGILCMIFNIVGLVVASDPSALYVGHGIWCGLIFILTGSFGIPAGRVKSKCMIITFMVLSIISAILALGAVLIVSAIALGIHASKCYHKEYYYYPYYHYVCVGNAGDAIVAMDSLLVFLALLEGFVAIWSSAICCAAVCCGSRPSQGQVLQLNAPVVQYSQATGGPQVMCLTSQLQGVGYPQQPQLQQVIPQQAFYPQQQQQLTQGPQATGVMTPPPYEQRPPPQQQTKITA